MGLKTDLIDAKIEGLKLSGASDKAIQQAEKYLSGKGKMPEYYLDLARNIPF